MKINFGATVHISVDELTQLVTEAVERKVPRHKVTKINYNVRTTTTGYGMNEHDETVFTGCDVELKSK